MKQHFFYTLFFCFSLVSLSAQNSQSPSPNSLQLLASSFSEQLERLASDTTMTFERIQPYVAQMFGAYQTKKRREKRQKSEPRYLFVVTLDGMRWQEIFNGADSTLLLDPEYTSDTAFFKQQYWAATSAERRTRLMPFLWNIVSQKGQIYGNRARGNLVNVRNHKWFSYPGYNEMLTGAPDDLRIFSNAKLPNPNVNVLEYLHRKRGFRNKVAAFSSWDVFPAILNEKRAGFPVVSGSETRHGCAVATSRQRLAQMEAACGSVWDEQADRADVYTWAAAEEYLKSRHPRVCFIGFGDTDEFAHTGDYDLYLQAAQQNDAALAALWQLLQTDPQYRGKSTLLITTDHGRGSGQHPSRAWRDHNARVPGADEIWLAVLGPDTPVLGEVTAPMQIWQAQIATTMAALVGHHFQPNHEVADRIESVFRGVPFLPIPTAPTAVLLEATR